MEETAAPVDDARPGDAAASRGPAWLGLPLDAHLHSDFSADADVPIDVHAALARERGLDEIILTDHLDFHADDPNFRLGDYERRRSAVEAAVERWDGRPNIRFGVEISYERALQADIGSYLARHPYDYVIGSVHVTSRHPLRAPETAAVWCAGKSIREASAWYWDEVEAAAQSGLFDTLGHLDFVKRYIADHLGPMRYGDLAPEYDRVLRALVESDTALEVNSSGLRQQAREMYPGPGVVERFRVLGGTRVVTGSDAHRSETFGFALADAYELVRAAGYEELSFRRGADRATVAVTVPRHATAP